MSEIPVTYTGDASSLVAASDQASSAVTAAAGDMSSASSVSIGASAGMGGSFMRMGVMGMASFMMIDAASQRLQATQMQQTMAQERLTLAVQKYGAGSTQAILASQQLQVTTDLVARTTDQYYMRLAMMGAFMIPQVISMVTKLTSALGTMSAENEVATTTTWGLTNAQLALMAATGVGLIAAIAIAAAISSGAFNPQGGGTSNINVYGDVNVPSATNPAAFASSLGSYRG